MVTFSNTDGVRYDSVNSQSTVHQRDVKIPVQPLNFDIMHKGALMGAHYLLE